MISLDQAKLHLRVDGTDDDALIASIIASAEAYVSGQTGLDLADDAEEPAPPHARHALLLLIGTLYATRESESVERLAESRTFRLLMTSLSVPTAGIASDEEADE